MRWMWIDRIVEFVPGERMVTIKNVSLAEEHLHDHFPADGDRGLPALPIMPACFMIEGMAQTAGILVGHASGFKEKVILAKVNRARIDHDAAPGDTLRYTASLDRLDDTGAATSGVVELVEHTSSGASAQPREVGRIDLMFSHIDRNMAGEEFPEHNFVFSDSFRTILRTSGIDVKF